MNGIEIWFLNTFKFLAFVPTSEIGNVKKKKEIGNIQKKRNRKCMYGNKK